MPLKQHPEIRSDNVVIVECTFVLCRGCIVVVMSKSLTTLPLEMLSLRSVATLVCVGHCLVSILLRSQEPLLRYMDNVRLHLIYIYIYCLCRW